jgi:hypothetical protein
METLDVSKLNSGDRDVLALLASHGHLNMMTDYYGQIIIYTDLALLNETGELVDFDVTAAESDPDLYCV